MAQPLQQVAFKSCAGLASAIRSPAFPHASLAVLSQFEERIQKSKELNAFVNLCFTTARIRAAASDTRSVSGSLLGELDGVHIAVKDNFCVKGTATTCSSRALNRFIPGYTATCIERLEEQGVVIVGKTNMDEFGMGSFNLNSATGPSINPHKGNTNTPHTPGGSSGGSAVAVASGCCVAAIGSDTGGSVRLPAAYCGVVGWKPSYGRTSRFGLVAFASSLDTPGVFANNVRDAATIANAMSGDDISDATCTLSKTTFVPTSGSDLKGVTVGIPQEYFIEELSAPVLSAWKQTEEWLASRGATIVSVTLPRTKDALSAYYLLALAEASSNMARYDGMHYGLRVGEAATTKTVQELITNSRGESFGEEVKRRILTGTFTLSQTSYDSYYLQAQRVRRLVKTDFERVFDAGVDVLLTPTAPSAAPTIIEAENMARLETYANDVFTVPASLAGLPAISVPAGYDDNNMPLGVQLIGAHGCEHDVLRVAQVVEDVWKNPV
eukprot:m.21229 g.21229  ORF g.21229 m.21229 type:complete len:496 (+) comp13313_c0_seq1:19-1506(+)